MNKKYSDAGEAVLAFLRAELEHRYLYDNVRRFKELKDLDDGVVTAFRDFALSRVYPGGAARAEIDEAFADLDELLRSPRKMASLGAVAVAAVWRLGRRLPMAVSAGQQVIHAFSCASAVETLLRESVLERGLPWQSGLERGDMASVFSRLPAQPFGDLVDALVQLLELAANRETMETGLGLLEKISETMARSAGQWNERDRNGVRLAMGTLSEALELFDKIDPRDAPRFIKGIRAVEMDWYRTLRKRK